MAVALAREAHLSPIPESIVNCRDLIKTGCGVNASDDWGNHYAPCVQKLDDSWHQETKGYAAQLNNCNDVITGKAERGNVPECMKFVREACGLDASGEWTKATYRSCIKVFHSDKQSQHSPRSKKVILCDEKIKEYLNEARHPYRFEAFAWVSELYRLRNLLSYQPNA